MTISRHTIARAGTVALAALALAACGESTSPLDVSPEQLESMGSSIATEIEAGVRQLTAQDVMSSNGGAPSFTRLPASSSLLLSRGLSFSRSGSGATDPVDCGVWSQNPPTDSDGDNVPDNLSVTFALPACHFADLGSSIDVTGALRLWDPFPTTAGLALNYALDNFRVAFASSDGSGSVTRNGTASVAASESGLSQSMDWAESASFTGYPAIGADINWTASFVAAEGQSIVAGQPLPSGAYQANGTVGYREGRRTAGFSVTTITPLQYSASCAAGVAAGTTLTPFTAGRMRVAVTNQEGRGFADVTYADCNAAVVVFGQQ